MASPYKCKKMRVTIYHTGMSYTLGVVEGYDIELIKEGGVTPYYDSETGKHAVGTRHATFRLRRWFKADDSNTDLIYDLFNDETHFDLWGELNDVAGSRIILSDCLIYRYAPRTGGANDIIAEEGTGEARDYSSNIT